MARITDDILCFIYNKGETRYTDLLDAFVNSGKCANQTFINHKKELEKVGLIKKKISELTKRPVYYVPDEHKEEAAHFFYRNLLHHLIDDYFSKEKIP